MWQHTSGLPESTSGERGDEDARLRASSTNGDADGRDSICRLHVDVEPGRGKGVERFIEGEERRAWSRPGGSETCKHRHGRGRDAPVAAVEPVERLVVPEDRSPVTRCASVCLDVGRSDRDGRAERLDRVLRRPECEASVSEDARGSAIQVGVLHATTVVRSQRCEPNRIGDMAEQILNPLAAGALEGKRALVTGSSRGIGADTVKFLAQAGAKVVVNYRNKEARAIKLVDAIAADGGTAIAVGADLTDEASRQQLFSTIEREYGGLDVLVLNASGGMESGLGEDYALKLNRDAQVETLKGALELMRDGGRVVFVTSHQAHFIRTTPTMQEYEAVASSKRAGEDALLALVPDLTERGVEFVVVSGDMIEGTITATLLDRLNPGAIAARREEAGKLYNVQEFAAEVTKAVVEPVPADNLRLIGDTSGFVTEA